MRIKSLFDRPTCCALWTVLLVIVAHGAVQAGGCISAQIDEQIRLPDGSLHEPGTLRLCLDRDYSPVRSIHTASIDKRTIGFMNSRRSIGEGVTNQPFMMFARAADGRLQLYGYALPQRGQMNSYLLQSPPRQAALPSIAVDLVSLTALRIPAGAE